MKSDGKTEIVEGVTIDISTFVKLVNECITNSRSSYTKDMFIRDHSVSSQDDDKKEKPDEELTPTPSPDETMVTEADVQETTAPVQVPSQIGVIGGEDGVVSGDDTNVLSDSVDGIPMSEIRDYIDGLPQDRAKSEAILTTVNQAYKFIREYLKWVG